MSDFSHISCKPIFNINGIRVQLQAQDNLLVIYLNAEYILNLFISQAFANVKHFFTPLGKEFFLYTVSTFLHCSVTRFLHRKVRSFLHCLVRSFLLLCQVADEAGRYFVN